MLGSAQAARADAMITYDFSGTINQINDTSGSLGNQFQTGMPFTLQVTLPADTPNTLGSNTDYGHYTLPQPGMTLTINGQPYPLGPVDTSATGEVVAIPGQGAFYGTQTFLAPSNPNVFSERVDFNLLGHPGVLASDALPTSLNLANFTANTPIMDLFVFYQNSQYASVVATINSVSVNGGPGSVQTVPEPGTFVVVALGAAGLFALRRTRP
jgi:hypothetical protein